MNFYNENDPFAAAWLRELIKADVIAPGIVDERSIEDIKPEELHGYTQCHFFAGIGVWSYALRRAGWPDDRPVWTGSCPCQPFSAAGQRKGTTDERHLWPAWFHLIQYGKPESTPIFGEQVASKDAKIWLDLVQDDLEGIGHTCWPAITAACGFGAPHLRKRIYFVADSKLGRGFDGRGLYRGCAEKDGRIEETIGGELRLETQGSGSTNELGDPINSGLQGYGRLKSEFSSPRWEGQERHCTPPSMACELADTSRKQYDGSGIDGSRGRFESSNRSSLSGQTFWSECDWLPCIDGKARPVEPGTFPLAHGAAARVGRLRGYGNAIVAPQAQAFIESYLETQLLK